MTFGAVRTEPLNYMPRLDGLRAVAVVGVLLEHFLGSEISVRLGTGTLGVILFFVLSGYLITRLLLIERPRGPAAAAASFYWRRFLRLSPPYYLAIAFALAIGIGDMARNWPMHVLYLSNVQVAIEGSWNNASHFWSLAVEEQFYLAWFIVVVVAPARWLKPIVYSCVLIGPVFRLGIHMAGRDMSIVLLPGYVDCLAMGALLAVSGERLRSWFGWPMFIAASAALVFVALPYGWGSARKFVLFVTFANIAAACLVNMAARPSASLPLDWLSMSWLRHIGKISYGIYVYHFFVPQLAELIWPGYRAAVDGALSGFLISSALSLVVAQLSWTFLESPVLKLRDRVRPTSAALEPAVSGVSKRRTA